MTRKERERYHQLHPTKLVTDWATAILAGGLLWRRQWLPAIVIGFVPSIIVTAVFLSGRLDGGLMRIHSKPVARSVALCLSGGVNTIRFGGLALSWAGCWVHHTWWIPAGVLVIASGWWLAWRRGAADRMARTRVPQQRVHGR